jgi:hypothetical protein
MAGSTKHVGTWTRVLAFGLAVAFALFFAQTATHTHQNGQDETACQICHGAHFAPVPLVFTLAPHVLLVFESVLPIGDLFYQPFFLSICGSRAPPSVQ